MEFDHNSKPTRSAVLVLVLSAGGSLSAWERDGALDREWAVYARLSAEYASMVVVSDAGPGEAAREREIASTLGAALVMNHDGVERAMHMARLPDLVSAGAGELTGPVVVKTNQHSAADAALAIVSGLQRVGRRVALIARGGYLWTRFVAFEHGTGSRDFAECASRERELVRRADVVVGTSRSMLDDLAWRDGLAPEAMRLIPNYVVAGACFGPRQSPVRSREPGVLLYAGQLSNRKRVDLLIDATAMVARSGRRVMLEVRGEGPERAALEARAREVGAPVWFGPRIPHGDLLDRMRSCWAFVQASALEGHPKTILEAMSVGAAVVACEAPGVSDCDAVERDRTAVLSRPDAESLARSIARVLDEPGLAAGLGSAARERVLATCGLDAVLHLERAAHALALERAARRNATGAGGASAGVGSGIGSDVVVVSEPPPVRWDPALLGAERAEMVRCWERGLNGFAKRLEAGKRAAFLAELDTFVYSMQGEAAIAAAGGIHPKHDLMRYHDFFVERVSSGERVLDLGCGIGALATSIASRSGASVTGIDWSEKNLERARDVVARADGRVRLVHGDITKDRAPGEFDVVVLSNVLEHISERPERLRRWSEWYGSPRFLIRVPAFDREWRVPWKKALGVEWRLDLTHETEYTMEQLERELEEAGLTLDSVSTRWGEYYAQARAA